VASVIEAACAGTRPLPLAVPDSLADGFPIASLVTVEFELGAWAPEDFPFSDPSTRRAELAELPAWLQAARASAERVFGAGFDRPGGKTARPAPLAEKR